MTGRIVGLLALFCLPVIGFAQSVPATAIAAQPPPREVARTGTAIIRGRVVATDSGRPLRGAFVRVTAPELGPARTVVTDGQGRYEIGSLPAGRYTLTASRLTFISLSYGQTRPFETGKPIVVGNGQVIERIDFGLPRGGTIAGRIIDDQGEPVVNAMVSALRAQFQSGARRLRATGASVQTNDLGEFRIFGLSPGLYYVSTGFRLSGGVENIQSGFAPAYFPGTSNAAEAQRVNVEVGKTVNNIDMTLIPVRTASVSGTMSDLEGHPLPNPQVNLLQYGAATTQGIAFVVGAPDGTFKLSGIPPGTYGVDAMVPTANGGRSIERVTIAGEDISGLMLMPPRMSGGTGRIVVNPADARSLNLSQVRIGTRPADPYEEQVYANAATIQDDLTFDLVAPPGTLIVTDYGLPAGWRLKAVRYGDSDVTDTGISFKSGEKVRDIEVELSNRVSTLSGNVRNAKGEVVNDCAIVIFSQNEKRWTVRTSDRYFAVARPDTAGAFRVNTLAPGDYYAIALDYVDPSDAGDPELLNPLRGNATRVSLSEGETKTLDLKLTVQ